jgi:hypothetical protein
LGSGQWACLEKNKTIIFISCPSAKPSIDGEYVKIFLTYKKAKINKASEALIVMASSQFFFIAICPFYFGQGLPGW